MIINLKKFLFIGVKEDVDEFFDRAQQNGFMEFLSITGTKNVEMPASVHTLTAAMKVLRKLTMKEPYIGGGTVAFAIETGEKILQLKAHVEKLLEQKRFLEAEISRVSPFGEFSMEDIHFIEKETNQKIQFFCIKTAKSHKTNFSDEIIYVGTEYDLDYFISISPHPQSYPGMIEMHMEYSVNELRLQLEIINEQIQITQTELKSFAGHLEFLHWAFIEELNEYNLRCAKKEASSLLDHNLFAIEAWVPENKINSLFALISGMAIHCEQIAVDPEDRIPTCMQNKGVNRIGQDLVLIYDTPAPTDKDPSGWVFWSFLVFFAMIVADGGYGLLFLGLALFLKFKFPKLKTDARRLLKLFLFLSVSCVVWGLLSSSFFGLGITPENPIGKYSLFQFLDEKKAEYHFNKKDDVYDYWVKEYPALKNISNGKAFLIQAKTEDKGEQTYKMRDQFSENIVLELSLMLGVFHLTLSFLRNMWRNFAGIGWIAFMIGGYLYFPSMLNATSMVHYLQWVDKTTATQVGIQLMYGGIILACALALIQRRLKGIGEIANVVQVFADVLSYLRLYALGLAGSIMAYTFNDVGSAVGFAAGALVILLGHGVNIMLCTMSGVIHGLRLNFIEWYHYSFDGGGKLFNPLMKHKVK